MPIREQGEGLTQTAERAGAGKAPHVAAVTDLEEFKARRIEELAAAYRELEREAEAEQAEFAFGHVEALEDRVRVRIDNNLTPDATRALAIQMLAAADEIQGVGPGMFGYDPEDSKKLAELHAAIDEELPIPNDQALAGDYVGQVRDAGRTIRRQIARAVKLHRERGQRG